MKGDVIMAKTLLDSIYGCLIASAVGDALGAPTEGMMYKEIEEQYGRLTEFLPNPVHYTNHLPGAVTDDSQMRHVICKTIIDKGRRITPDDLANTMIAHLNPERVWISDVLALERLKAGISPWQSGFGGIPCGCACMGIAPIGIINAGDPEQAYQDGVCLSMVYNNGENTEFAGAFASAQAAAFIPDITIDGIVTIILKYSTDIVKRAFDLTMNLAIKSSCVHEFKEKFYEKLLDWTWTLPRNVWNKEKFFSGNSREFVPVIFAILHFEKNLNEAIIEGANFGRDCDTIASMVGNIAGAMQGASALRKDWIAICEHANEDMFEYVSGDKAKGFYYTAKKLVEAINNEKKYMMERVEFLNKLINN